MNTVENCDSYGINVTGVYQVTPDSLGAGGNNFTIIGNSVTGSKFGIYATSAYTFYPRDVIISSNVVEGCTGTGFVGAIELWLDQQSGAVVSNNNVKITATDMGINIDGDVDGIGNKATNVSVVGNNVIDVNGTAASSRGAIRLVDVNNFTVSANTIREAASTIGVLLLRCQEGAVTGNVYDSGNVVYGPSANTIVDVVYSANRGASMNVDGDNNSVLQNSASITGLPSTGSTPHAVGLFTFSAGIGYVSTGTSSSADWKQITP